MQLLNLLIFAEICSANYEGQCAKDCGFTPSW